MADYNKYLMKISALAKQLAFIRRHKRIIISCLIMLLTVISALVVAKGAFVESIYCPDIVYGQPLEVRASAFLSSVSYEYAPSGSEEWESEAPTFPGSYRVRAVSNASFGEKRYSETEFVINKRTATIRILPIDGVYGETIGKQSDIETENFCAGDNPEALDFVYNKNMVGETTVTIDPASIHVTNSRGEDVSEAYDYIIVDSTVKIYLRPITLTTSSLEKLYDGAPLLSDGNWSVSTGSLAGGDKIEITLSNGGTDIGVETHSITSLRILTSEGIDVTECYHIEKNEGKLKVAKSILTLSVPNLEKIYDGAPLYVDSLLEIEGEVLDGDTIESLVLTGGIVNVGSMKCEIAEFVVKNGIRDVTDEYIVRYTPGTLTVNPRVMKIHTSSAEKIYDGTALNNGDYTIVSGTFATGDSTQSSNVTTIIDAGETENIVTPIILNSKGENVTGNYQFEIVPGTLKISKLPLEIVTDNSVREYDGTPFAPETFKIKTGWVAPNQSVVGIPTKSLTNVGKIEHTLNIKVVDEAGEDVTHNYTILVASGSIEVTKRHVQILSVTEAHMYDATAKSSPKLTTTSGSLAEGHSFADVKTSSAIDVGEYENKILEYKIVDADGQDVTFNYDILEGHGTLIIEPRLIVLKASNASKVYDGTPLVSPSYSILGAGLVDGHVLRDISVQGSITDPGSVRNVISATGVSDASGRDISANYNIKYEHGTLRVTGVEISIRTGNASKQYDGTPLTNPEWRMVAGKLMNGHVLEVTVTGSRTEVGESENTFEYVITDTATNRNMNDYYSVVEDLGKLIVYAPTDTAPVLPEEDEYWETEPETTPNDQNNNVMVDDGRNPSSVVSDPIDESNASNNKNAVIRFKTDSSSPVYLRFSSYGDYIDSTWAVAPSYNVSKLKLNPLGFASNAMSKKANIYTIDIEILGNTNTLAVPYYTTGLPKNLISDSYYPLNGKSYTMSYAPLGSVATDMNGARLDPEFTEIEKAYYEFVLTNYMDVPEDVKAVLLSLAEENGIDPESETLINDISYFISHHAAYNRNFMSYPEGSDIVLYFLTEAREGICQHFASAATLMYRAMGIPARYTVGYYAMPNPGEWSEVYGYNAHAWVEIYIPGFGWAPVEVTASDSTTGEDDRPGNDQANDNFADSNDPTVTEIVLAMTDVRRDFNGLPLTSNAVTVVSGSLFEGDSIVARGSGSITFTGIAENKCVELRILDSIGNDVTHKYKINAVEDGTLIINAVVLQPPEKIELIENGVISLSDIHWLGEINYEGFIPPKLTVKGGYNVAVVADNILLAGTKAGEAVLNYSTERVDFNDDGFYEISASKGQIALVVKPFSHVASANRNVHVDISNNVIDMSKKDVEDLWYGINGKILNKLTVKIKDLTQVFDGELHTSNEYEILTGKLREGDTIVLTGTGSRIYSGTTVNDCASLTVFDSDGNDVTSQYLITVYSGNITIETATPKIASDTIDVKFGYMSDLSQYFAIDNVANMPISINGAGTNGRFILNGFNITGIVPGKAVLRVTYLPCDMNGDGYAEYGMRSYYVEVNVRMDAWQAILVIIFLLILAAGALVTVFYIRAKRNENPPPAPGVMSDEELAEIISGKTENGEVRIPQQINLGNMNNLNNLR